LTPNRAWKCLAAACAVLLIPAAHAAGTLENPQPGQSVAGLSLISGWNCDAKRIEFAIDGGARVVVPSGSSRADTASACAGNTATGFGYLINWALLPPGAHTLVAFGDGVPFATAAFTALRLDAATEFLKGIARTVQVDNFPVAGRGLALAWNEPTQSFAASQIDFNPPGFAGTWTGADLERRSGCASPQNDGNHGTWAQYVVNFSGGVFKIQQSSFTGPTGGTTLACTYSGSYPADAQPVLSGDLSCSDGQAVVKTGTFTSTRLLVTDREMSLQLAIKLTGNESCAIDATLGGSRF
jgi:hypothetical protein